MIFLWLYYEGLNRGSLHNVILLTLKAFNFSLKIALHLHNSHELFFTQIFVCNYMIFLFLTLFIILCSTVSSLLFCTPLFSILTLVFLLNFYSIHYLLLPFIILYSQTLVVWLNNWNAAQKHRKSDILLRMKTQSDGLLGSRYNS